MSILHRLRHLFGWNTGYVYSWWDADTGVAMSGFRCGGCGSIEHVSANPTLKVRSRIEHICTFHRLADGTCSECERAKAANTPQSKERPCTCHPDDLPPRPCPQKFALDECRLAHVLSMQGTNNVVR